MKKYLLLVVLLFTMSSAFSQTGKKPAPKKQPSSADMNKMLEDAMKAEGMSKSEQEEMKKMMKDIKLIFYEKIKKYIVCKQQKF